MIVAPRAVRPALHDETALVAARGDGATVWYSAPYTPVWSLSRGLSAATVPLEAAEAPE